MATTLTTIAIKDIDTSHYESSFPKHLAIPPSPSLIHSFHNSGILSPIWVTPTKTGYALLDGYTRLIHCTDTHIMASIVSESDFSHYGLMAEAHTHKLARSTIQKILFLLSWQSNDHPLTDYCKPLGLQHYNAMLVHSKKIAQLPETIQMRCHRYALSFSVCLRLASYTQELLHTMETAFKTVHVSNSNWLRIANQLHDLSKRHNQPASAILNQPDTQRILKTQGVSALIQHLSHQVQPTVHAMNTQLTQLSQTAPNGIHIEWDQSLENRHVSLTVTLTDEHDFSYLIQNVQNTQPVLSKMLALL